MSFPFIHLFIYLFILFETCLSLLYALRYTYGIVFGLTIKLHAIDKLIISSKSCFGFASIIENHRENKNAFPFCFGNRVNKNSISSRVGMFALLLLLSFEYWSIKKYYACHNSFSRMLLHLLFSSLCASASFWNKS